jgi:hypothetical protein
MNNIPSHITDKILDRISYIDTVIVILAKSEVLTDDELEFLNTLCGAARREKIEDSKLKYNWGTRVKLQQPSDEAITWLQNRYWSDDFERLKIVRLDYSLDLITSTKDDAISVRLFLEQHLIMRWHRDSNVVDFNETIYYRKRKSNNNIAAYSKKPSKLTGQPCCHIDWRIIKAGTLKRLGINNLFDVLNVDQHEFWRTRLLLKEANKTRIGKILSNKPNWRKPLLSQFRGMKRDKFTMAGEVMCRSTQTADLPYTVQGIIDRLRRIKRQNRGCLIEINNDAFLPDKG